MTSDIETETTESAPTRVRRLTFSRLDLQGDREVIAHTMKTLRSYLGRIPEHEDFGEIFYYTHRLMHDSAHRWADFQAICPPDMVADIAPSVHAMERCVAMCHGIERIWWDNPGGIRARLLFCCQVFLAALDDLSDTCLYWLPNQYEYSGDMDMKKISAAQREYQAHQEAVRTRLGLS